MLERRDRELRELRERDLNERLKEEMFKSRPLDAHWLEMQRYVTSQRAGGTGGSTGPSPFPSWADVDCLSWWPVAIRPVFLFFASKWSCTLLVTYY